MVRRLVMLTAVSSLALLLRAHTVPTITVEAEFTAARQITLRVNLDPRLFLSAQPASLPPVPASWWFDQAEKERARTVEVALAYLDKALLFQIGETPLPGIWRLTAVDSASAFPLGSNSAEVHLLAERSGALPDVAGDFKVTLDGSAPVGLILLNSMEGKAERHPQAIFPGESSRGFKLPERVSAPAAAPIPDRAIAAVGCCDGLAGFCQLASRHFAGDHLLVALALAIVLGGRPVPGVGMIAAFLFGHIAGALAVAGGWLPDAPVWVQAAGWVGLAAGIFLAYRRRLWRAGTCFAIAGCAHGLNLPHLHLAVGDSAAVLRDAGLIGATQFAVLALVWAVGALVSRRRSVGKSGARPC